MRSRFLTFFSVVVVVLVISCTKSGNDTISLYIPTSADVTANATLPELQQGRALYINNCGQCHGLYSTDNYSSSQWSGIISSMAPKTRMSSSEILLVTKYVTRGK